MFGIDPRAARATWTVLLTLGVAAAVYALRHTLLVFIFAILLAYLLSPAVTVVNRISLRKTSHTVSLAVVYLLMLGGIGAVLSAVAASAAEEAARLAQTLPQYVKNPPAIPDSMIPAWILPHKQAILDGLRAKLEEEAQEIVPMLAHAGRGALAAIGNLVSLILVPVLSFFFLNSAAGMRDALLARISDPPARERAARIAAELHRVMGQFIKAMVLLGFSTFLTYAVVLGTLGVPYSLLLSVLAGAVEFIPVAGPLSASLAIVIVASVTGFPHVLGIVVFLIVYRLFLDYVLQPWIMGGGLELPPLAIIFAVLAGEELAGIVGMILAIPVLAVTRVILEQANSREVAE